MKDENSKHLNYCKSHTNVSGGKILITGLEDAECLQRGSGKRDTVKEME